MVTDLSGDDELLEPAAARSTTTGGDVDDFGADPDTGEIPAPGISSEEAQGPEFPNVYVFVTDLLAPLYARWDISAQGDFRWCSWWFEHAEALSRLDALWQAFEVLRREPGTGPATWWRDFADPTMNVLTSRDGPFRKCSGDKHNVPLPLPTAALDAALLAEHTERRTETTIRHTPGVDPNE